LRGLRAARRSGVPGSVRSAWGGQWQKRRKDLPVPSPMHATYVQGHGEKAFRGNGTTCSLLLPAVLLLLVGGAQQFPAALHGRLGEGLTLAQRSHRACTLELLLELLQRFINWLAFFHRDD